MYTYLQTLHVIQDLKDHQDQTHIKAALTGFYSTPAPLRPMHHATRVWFEQTDSIRRFYYPWVQAGGAYQHYTSRVYF